MPESNAREGRVAGSIRPQGEAKWPARPLPTPDADRARRKGPAQVPSFWQGCSNFDHWSGNVGAPCTWWPAGTLVWSGGFVSRPHKAPCRAQAAPGRSSSGLGRGWGQRLGGRRLAGPESIVRRGLRGEAGQGGGVVLSRSHVL